MGCKVAIRGRIPLRVIHSVQNPVQIGGAFVQYSFQLLAKLRRLNLLGIFAAHRCQLGGKLHRSLQKIEVVVLLHLVHRENVPREQQLLRGVWRELPLKCCVVNRQHAGRAAHHRIRCVGCPQIHRNQSRLPVVDVENLRRAHNLRRLNHCPAEQPKALGIVAVIAALRAIKLLPVKQFRGFNKVVLHPITLAAINHSDEPVVVTERNGERTNCILRFSLQELAHARVERQINRDLVAQLCQLRG